MTRFERTHTTLACTHCQAHAHCTIRLLCVLSVWHQERTRVLDVYVHACVYVCTQARAGVGMSPLYMPIYGRRGTLSFAALVRTWHLYTHGFACRAWHPLSCSIDAYSYSSHPTQECKTHALRQAALQCRWCLCVCMCVQSPEQVEAWGSVPNANVPKIVSTFAQSACLYDWPRPGRALHGLNIGILILLAGRLEAVCRCAVFDR